MRPATAFAIHLANALVNCSWSPLAMKDALTADLPAWLSYDQIGVLVDEILTRCPTPYAPTRRQLVRIIYDCPSFGKIWNDAKGRIRLDHQTVLLPQFRPLPVFADLEIPALTSLHELADWLGLSLSELDWMAGRQGHYSPARKDVFRHYHLTVRQKSSGGLRLIEAPKRRLKSLQRQILRDILEKVPVHKAAHGFVKGRSAITAAKLHAGEIMVVKLDLADYFPSVPARRIEGIYRCLGYPRQVANYLAGLTTSRVPREVLREIRFDKKVPEKKSSPLERAGRFLRGLFSSRERVGFDEMSLYYYPHLPQGAPTSPMLANLATHSLDRRLAGLSRRFDANYTRYADDLAFSGDREFARKHKKFLKLAYEIVRDEKFTPRQDKTRVMGAGARQQVTGIIVNQHINMPRDEFDRLKAILHNCVRQGPAGQNREGHADFRAHLDGRISWAEQLNLRRGLKLRHLFEQIDWQL